jgi:DNA mismatch repair protein MutL
MGQEIQQLDPTTVERIAAGEVVERPASVVKELVENSLDADASRVRVAVEAGGKDGITVSDDGIGMSESALQRAVEQHTTSKIRDIDDLEGGVGTLGFRGEALHAIGAVSRLTITSRPRGGDQGTELTVEGGDVESVRPAGCPEGTTIEVADLFYNVPARRKYLKQVGTEFAHVNTVVTAYALANPDVAVELEHDGRETFATPGRGDLRETVMAVYGREVAESMIQIRESDLPDGSLEDISGLVSHPETNRAGREYCSTYVNGRYVTANAVRDAVEEAYGGQLAADRHPFAVLFVSLPAGEVDVNVHPRKLEVRFADEAGVARQVTAAVESALLREGLLRSSAPRGRSAVDQTEISPQRSADTGDERDDSTTEPSKSDNSHEGIERRGADTTAESDTTTTTPTDHSTTGGRSRPAAGTRTDSGGDTDSNDFGSGDSETESTDVDSRTPGTPSVDGTVESDSHERNNTDSTSITATDQRRFGDDDPTERSFETLPSMRVLGQLAETYVVAEGPDGLLLIDQHAADERINYERLKERFAGDTQTQALAQPVSVEVTAREAELFETVTAALSRIGFRAERVDDRTIAVRTVPALLAEAGGPELIRDVLSSFTAGADAAAGTVESAVEELLADLACYPSVTANTDLTDGSILSLLSALDDCDNPYACPHGRPVVVEIDGDEIADRFERDYPGHG